MLFKWILESCELLDRLLEFLVELVVDDPLCSLKLLKFDPVLELLSKFFTWSLIHLDKYKVVLNQSYENGQEMAKTELKRAF